MQPGAIRVRIGRAELLATNICERCVVPTRDSHTGQPTERFVARFTSERAGTLPATSPRNRFDKFYRLAINMLVASNAGEQSLNVGEVVEIGDFVAPE